MKPPRPHTLEARALDLLRPFSLHDSTRYTLRAHALLHDGHGWSSNDRFTIAQDVDLAEALKAIRGRWEAFRANYSARARVSDLDSLYTWHPLDQETAGLRLEADRLAFLDIEGTGPLVTLYDLTRDAEQIDPADIRADLEKARREFTLEEYPAALHSARLAALDQLKTLES